MTATAETVRRNLIKAIRRRNRLLYELAEQTGIDK